jgi:hypothetical protein
VTELRTQLSWMAPELATDGGPAGLHSGRRTGSGAAVSADPGSVSDVATYDEVLAAALDAGIDAGSADPGKAARCGSGEDEGPGKRCNRLFPVLPTSCRGWGAPERGV